MVLSCLPPLLSTQVSMETVNGGPHICPMQLCKELCDFVVNLSPLSTSELRLNGNFVSQKVQFAPAVTNATDSRKLGGHPEEQLTEQQ